MRRMVLILAATALAAAGCGSEGPRASQGAEDATTPSPAASPGIRDNCSHLTRGETAEILAVDNYFAPECSIVTSAQDLRIRNLGVRDHAFTISAEVFGRTPFLLDIDDIEGGESKTASLDGVLEPGTYEFFCKYHEGMDGELQVVEPVNP